MNNKEKILKLRKELEDLKNRIPAHSVKPEILQRMEEIEYEIEKLKNCD